MHWVQLQYYLSYRHLVFWVTRNLDVGSMHALFLFLLFFSAPNIVLNVLFSSVPGSFAFGQVVSTACSGITCIGIVPEWILGVLVNAGFCLHARLISGQNDSRTAGKVYSIAGVVLHIKRAEAIIARLLPRVGYSPLALLQGWAKAIER